MHFAFYIVPGWARTIRTGMVTRWRTRSAVLPRISGRGWLVGTHTSAVEATDPYQLGYVLSDLWGDEVGSL